MGFFTKENAIISIFWQFLGPICSLRISYKADDPAASDDREFTLSITKLLTFTVNLL